MGDAMKSLENKTLDSKRDMDILSALDEMKSMKVLPHSNIVISMGQIFFPWSYIFSGFHQHATNPPLHQICQCLKA